MARRGLKEVITGRPDPGRLLAEEQGRRQMADVQADYFKESLDRVELQMEDEGWRKMAFNARREFTRPGLDDIIEVSRLMYLIHPLIQRAVNVTTYYTWAQGATFKAVDDRIQNEVVKPQMDDDGNRAELYGHQARLLTQVDQMCDGSVFLALFTNPLGEVSVRSIPTEDIREIHTKPGDRQQIWYYRRRWIEQVFDQKKGTTLQKPREVLYPDWRYQPKKKPPNIGGIEVMWDAPIMHRRTGGLKQMQFGIPSTYSALEWARAYKKFLEDWHSLVHSLSTFAWNKTAKGRKAKDTAKKLEEETKHQPRRDVRTPKTENPEVGAVHVAAEGDELTPIPKSSAHTSADDAKPSRLMVASAMDLPDTILSNDPQQGALATAKTLDRPSELGFMNWQKLEQDWHSDIFRYSVDARVRRGRLPGRVITLPDGLTVVEPNMDPSVTLAFPPILEHDQKDVIQSIVAAATLEGRADAGTLPREQLSTMLMENLGVDDVETALKELDAQDNEQLKQAVETLRETAKALIESNRA